MEKEGLGTDIVSRVAKLGLEYRPLDNDRTGSISTGRGVVVLMVSLKSETSVLYDDVSFLHREMCERSR